MARQSVLTAAGESHPETAARTRPETFLSPRGALASALMRAPSRRAPPQPSAAFSLIPADFEGSWSSWSSSSVPQRSIFIATRGSLFSVVLNGFLQPDNVPLTLKRRCHSHWPLVDRTSHSLTHSPILIPLVSSFTNQFRKTQRKSQNRRQTP